ncbi:lysozyme inhibitor LprI family protein [Lysobacter silvisoli]|nr:lysozyme inhibitor LprI family protein [Lysobacter silvisoli]
MNVLLVAAASVVLASCGGKIRSEFVAGCMSQGAPKENCTCLYEKLEEKYGADALEEMNEGKRMLPGFTEATVVGAAECSGADPSAALKQLGLDGESSESSNSELGELAAEGVEAEQQELPEQPDAAAMAANEADAAAESAKAAQAPDAPAPVEAQVSISPSFDCAKAASHVELSICRNSQLAQADVSLAQVYKLATACTKDKVRLREAQRTWMSERNACTDDSCVVEAYARRSADLAEECTG